MVCKYNCKRGKVYLEAIKDFVDCPECSSVTAQVKNYKDKNNKTLLDKLRIPEFYQDSPLSDEVLFCNSSVYNTNNESVKQVIELMKRINCDIAEGRVTKLSCYIHAGVQIDIKCFVYGVLKKALERKLKVVPYISLDILDGLQRVRDFPVSRLLELEDIMKVAKGENDTSVLEKYMNTLVSGKLDTPKDVSREIGRAFSMFPTDIFSAYDGYRFMNDTGLTSYDYYTADICFIKANANTSNRGWSALAHLLNEREGRNLPTYVIGYWRHDSEKWNRIDKYPGIQYLINKGNYKLLKLLVPFEVSYKKENKR